MIVRKIRRKIPDERIEGPSTKKLYGMLPLVGTNEIGICDDFNRCRLKALIQLIESELLALLEQAMELIYVNSRLRDLADVMMECIRVLDRQGDGVVLILKFGVEVLSPHPKFPCLPGTTTIGLVHSLIQGTYRGVHNKDEGQCSQAIWSRRRASSNSEPRPSVSARLRVFVSRLSLLIIGSV